MAIPDGTATPALTQLCRVIREYTLFQAVLQVTEHLREAHPLLDDDALYDQLEFQANPGLGFAAHDIDRVEFFMDQGQLRARLRLNVLGLFGAGSPLPAFYGEQAFAERSGGNPTRDFLDLFHHRLHRLMLPIWRKYRYRACFRAGANDRFSEQMFALMGLGAAAIRGVCQVDCKRLLPYLGLLSLRVHSAALIESVLRYYFMHEALFLEQWVARTVEVCQTQRNHLGRANSALGDDLILGHRIADRSGKFRVHVRALCRERFHDFLPTGSAYQPLRSLVRLTLRDPLDYDLSLMLAQGQIKALHIGENTVCRLGWTTWLAHEQADGVVTLTHNSSGINDHD
ncbi:type VI secretion system baseplate subunit TssG [Pseudomonas sp. PA-1-2A]|uniref:type VI secretion system baseplate subunit TssG n=1 Tax=Pseudomonas TaxID=286 RepID=UPI001EF0C12A|nr:MULTISPECIES: type VI secretion system baseplate subunit TssG [Pseudomonas]MCF5692813.1 type VI secretion system baseplate subunit TssG [Pseudomonas sp. PA-1-8C]MCF5788408.1 type VI secretion system baseplate subunit TssG [Pseudomonas sp. PA-1-6G]MCF5792177.1 type VI secretion system baseplate subunit TssG [Pseudomonas sp. PA-1-6B]MCF5796939.1 type VI secretion system baseplate subunit TssG [Pseudomonas sp. PA-1-5A]MCF5815589.1 type VI secretion system baseplate subunit TssG [Pseudomonas sp